MIDSQRIWRSGAKREDTWILTLLYCLISVLTLLLYLSLCSDALEKALLYASNWPMILIQGDESLISGQFILQFGLSLYHHVSELKQLGFFAKN